MMSRGWETTFKVLYRVLGAVSPLVRVIANRFGLGNVVELVVVGRRTGRPHTIPLGLLRIGRDWYLGHPNGATSWTRNLDAAGSAMLILPHQQPVAILPELLIDPDERRRVISTTWHQHPFPGNLIYWLARRHIGAVGRYYRIEAVLSVQAGGAAGSTGSTAASGPGSALPGSPE
jgi:hypothetical protein